MGRSWADWSGLFVFVFVRGRRSGSRVPRQARGPGFTVVPRIFRQLRHRHPANTGRFPSVSISLLASARIDGCLSLVLVEAYSAQNDLSSRARITLVKTIPPIRLE